MNKAVADLVAVLRELGPIITAATPVLLILVNWYVTRRQTRDLKAHSDENRAQIQSTVASSSGTYRKLPEGGA
jgi:hypothetical protein